MHTLAPRRLTCLALALGLLLTACGGDDGDDGALVIRTDAEGNVVDEDGTPLDDDAAADDDPGDADDEAADVTLETDAEGNDDDADAPDDEQEPAAAPSGAGAGEVVVDGTTHALGEVVRCPADGATAAAPDNMDGLAELMASIDTLGIIGTGDAGRFQLYLSELDIGARSLNLMWEQGPGDATFTADYGQIAQDRPWTGGDGMTEPDEAPLALADGRVAGSAELTSRTGDEVTVRFDLPIPAEATC